MVKEWTERDDRRKYPRAYEHDDQVDALCGAVAQINASEAKRRAEKLRKLMMEDTKK